jgi:trypsin-like peptidase
MKSLLFVLAMMTGIVARQSAPPPKDIPAIAKAANGAIVSIVMSDKDGHVIAQGSGFLISSDGVILTNYHVIAEGVSAVVKLPDGAFYEVDGVFASDKARDVALIKAHGEKLRTLTLGDSDRVQVGEEVVAIGNPLSLESTVSNGIISGIRTAESLGGKFLQITTPISPGSSGGPLFNMAGEVIGITTMKLQGGENLNFAIPINEAKLLLSRKSAKLQNLPNEAEPKEVASKESPAPPSAGNDLDSPAYRQYQELLKANDPTIATGLYACFYDSEERSTKFFVILAHLLDKSTMNVLVNNFTDGVVEGSPLVFEGKIKQFSSKQGIFADLPSLYTYKSFDKSHETDVLKWVSGNIAIEVGWGQEMPGQVRMGYRFTMQHSTGNFVEDTELNFPGEDSKSNSTIHETGHCVRIPNIVKTPEEQFELE